MNTYSITQSCMTTNDCIVLKCFPYVHIPFQMIVSVYVVVLLSDTCVTSKSMRQPVFGNIPAQNSIKHFYLVLLVSKYLIYATGK